MTKKVATSFCSIQRAACDQIFSATISTTSGVIISTFGFSPAPAKSARTLFSEDLIDPTHLNQARKINFNECHRPLPHVVSRTHTKDMRCGRPNNKPILREQHREIGRAIRFSARLAPGCDHVPAKFFLTRDRWKKTPGSIVSVFVKDRDTAFRHCIAEFFLINNA